MRLRLETTQMDTLYIFLKPCTGNPMSQQSTPHGQVLDNSQMLDWAKIERTSLFQSLITLTLGPYTIKRLKIHFIPYRGKLVYLLLLVTSTLVNYLRAGLGAYPQS